jgi:hypothetical protein
LPEICRFYGIIIKMFYDDHNPPHFHVEYGSYKAIIDIDSVLILDGKLPSRCYELIKEWTNLHKEEIKLLWEKAKDFEPITGIAPLE